MSITELEQAITTADTAYYTNGKSDLTDYEYDRLKAELKDLDPTNHLLADLGCDHVEGFAKVKHEARMLSLEKIQAGGETDEYVEIDTWVRNKIATTTRFTITPKVDGVSAEALYQDGKLISVSTRGNGDEGDDITENTKQCFPETIPPTGLPSRFVLRGELYISKLEFESINVRQEAAGLPLFANARNLCAGTVKSKVRIPDRKVEFVLHGFKDLSGDGGHESLQDALCYITSRVTLDRVPSNTLVAGVSIPSIASPLNAIDKARDTYPFCIDGAVIKVDDIATQDSMGDTDHHPRWAVAYKYKPEIKAATVIDIVWQSGAKTGKLTPVGILTPITLDGTIVTRVSLANAGRMAARGISIGSIVFVEKANEIIPHVVDVFAAIPYTAAPTMECPSCHNMCALISGKTVGTADYYCTNALCPARRSSTLQSAFGSGGLNVLGIGPELCTAFIAETRILYPLELVTFAQTDYPASLSPLQKAKLFAEIQKVKQAPLYRWLAAAQFTGAGVGTAKKITQHCRDFVDFNTKILSGDNVQIPCLSAKIFASIKSEMLDCPLWELFSALEINPKSDNYVEESGPKPFTGMSFVVTGSFNYGRGAVEQMVASLGGAVKSAVSKKTTYLVAGQDVGAAKTNKAKDLNIPVISEDEFFALIEKSK